jgi:hypothetical protein
MTLPFYQLDRPTWVHLLLMTATGKIRPARTVCLVVHLVCQGSSSRMMKFKKDMKDKDGVTYYGENQEEAAESASLKWILLDRC